MNRRKWIGLLVGLAVIVVIGIIVTSTVESPFGGDDLDARQGTLDAAVRAMRGATATAASAGRATLAAEETATAAARALSCDDFPQYCVPLAGWPPGGGALAGNEDATARALDAAGAGVAGVVRGYTVDQLPLLGDPAAPLQLALFTDPVCSACQAYHLGELQEVIEDLVLSGEASLRLVLLADVGGAASERAAQAMLCAGEQGGLWELGEALAGLGNPAAYTLARIATTAAGIGLDGAAITACLEAGTYAPLLEQYAGFAIEQGVAVTPTLLARLDESGGWQTVERDVAALRALIEAGTR